MQTFGHMWTPVSVDFSRYWQRDKDAAVASCLIQGVPETLFEKAANLYQGVEHTEHIWKHTR